MPFVTGPLFKSPAPTRSRPGSRQASPPAPPPNAKRIFHKEFDSNAGNTTIAVSVKTKADARKRSLSSSTSGRPACLPKPRGGDAARRRECPNATAREALCPRSRHTVASKPDAKHLTWSHTLREQTIHGKACIVPKRERDHESPAPNKCRACTPLKIETNQFINRITDFVSEEQLNAALSECSTTRAQSSTESSRATNPSGNQMSEADNLLFMNQSVQCQMRSTSTMKTRSSKPSSTETFQHDVDEFFTNNTRFFPSCYHPITSIGFQCKELKLHLEKSSVCFKIVRGIEYNLGRITAAMLDTKWTDSLDILNPDGDGQPSLAKQLGKMHDMKLLCKSLKEDKQLVQDELDAQAEKCAEWKVREKELVESNEQLSSKLEDSARKTEEYCTALSSSAQLIAELQEEGKVVPLLRSIQARLNERIETVVRDNEMLKLDVQKLRLERESFRTMLQHKDLEIRKFKTEIVEVHQAAADQFSKMQTLNHEQRLKHLNARVRYSNHSRSDPDGLATPKGSSATDEDEMYIGRALWEGGGESALFPVSSSPSSDRSDLSLGPYPSWEQISPIASDATHGRSKGDAQSKPAFQRSDLAARERRSIVEERSAVEDGPYEITEETMQRLEFLRLHTDSSVDRVTPVSNGGRPRREPQTKSQQYPVPVLPKPPIIDLLPPPSELSHWTESFDDLDMFSVSQPEFLQEKTKPK